MILPLRPDPDSQPLSSHLPSTVDILTSQRNHENHTACKATASTRSTKKGSPIQSTSWQSIKESRSSHEN